MTEPIAVDVPGKPAFARSLPGPAPAPAPLPKADAPKPELTRPPAAVTPAPSPTGTPAPKVTPPAPPDAPGVSPRLLALLARVGKRRAVVAASAVFSLAAGVAGVRLMFPAADETPPATTAELKPAGESGAPAPTPPAVKEEPPVVPGSGDRIPPIPVAPYMGGPAEPLAPAGAPGSPPAIKPTTIQPAPGLLPPPALEEQPGSKPAGAVPPPSFEIPVASLPPLPGGVVPTGGTDPKSPAAPSPLAPPPTLPALPSLPDVTPPTTGMTPATPLPGTTPEPKTPATPPGTGTGGNGTGRGPLPPVGVEPISPTPALPKLPDVTPPDAPKSAESTPVSPKPPGPVMPVPPAGGTTGTTPGVLPIDPKPAPKTDVKPPPPTFDPPAAPGTPVSLTKPAGSTEVRPAAPEVTPRTDFDVDLYDPKASDSYESISLEFYNDRRFAAALKAFNRGQPLQGGRMVEVPPIHILKRKFPGQAGATPTGGATPSVGVPDWSPAGGRSDPTPVRAAGGRATFVVPPGGMSMRAVARLTLGSEQRWRDVYDLNPQFRSDEVLPAGTELRLPADARLP